MSDIGFYNLFVQVNNRDMQKVTMKIVTQFLMYDELI